MDLCHMQAQLLLKNTERVSSKSSDDHGSKIGHVRSTLECMYSTSNTILQQSKWTAV